MGLILQIIFEFFLEFIVQVLGEVLLEAGFQKLWDAQWDRKTVNTILALVIYFSFGVIIGWLSTLIFPHSFIRSSNLHGISLVITPTLAGLTMSGIGRIRQWQDKPVLRLDTFGYGFVFALGMSLIRFFFTT